MHYDVSSSTGYLAPCDFGLFSKVKMIMKGKHFEWIRDIKTGTRAQLDTHNGSKSNGIIVFKARNLI